jgi:hypothetical protein
MPSARRDPRLPSDADAKGDERVHDDFVRDAGYNRWAGGNRIVVLYPQATEATGNPRAC